MTERPTVISGRGIGRAAGGLCGLAMITMALYALGRGALATPPTTGRAALEAWTSTRDPITIGFALFRLAALALSAHLTVATAVLLTGRIIGRADLISLATRVTLPPLRGVLAHVAGVSLTAGVVLSGPLPASAATRPPSVEASAPSGTATLVVLEPPRTGGTAVLVEIGPTTTPQQTTIAVPPQSQPTTPPSTSTQTTQPAGQTPSPPPSPSTGTTPAAPAPPPSVADGGPVAPSAHVVRPGDHLWSIAEDSLALRIGRPPSEDEIAPYWRRVVAANPQLANPDLIFPGEKVWVPAP